MNQILCLLFDVNKYVLIYIPTNIYLFTLSRRHDLWFISFKSNNTTTLGKKNFSIWKNI